MEITGNTGFNIKWKYQFLYYQIINITHTHLFTIQVDTRLGQIIVTHLAFIVQELNSICNSVNSVHNLFTAQFLNKTRNGSCEFCDEQTLESSIMTVGMMLLLLL